MNIDRLRRYRNGLNVERLHTIAHVTPYSNGSHSCNAALVALELCEINGLDIYQQFAIIKYMLLHDIAEEYTGDIPSDVKRQNPDLKSVLDDIEAKWEKHNIPDMPELEPEDKDIAKCADLIELGMYCLDELYMGNKNMEHVLSNVVRYIWQYKAIEGIEDFINYAERQGYYDI